MPEREGARCLIACAKLSGGLLAIDRAAFLYKIAKLSSRHKAQRIGKINMRADRCGTTSVISCLASSPSLLP